MPPAAILKVTLKCYNPDVTFDPVTIATDPHSMKGAWKEKLWRKEKCKWAGERQEVTVMEIRCESRGEEAMKWKKRRADGVKKDAGIGGGVQEDEGAEVGSFLLLSVSFALKATHLI